MTGLAGLRPTTLEALDATVPLLVRTDRKHVVATEALGALLAALEPTHAALEVGGRRVFTYDSVYFDTPGLGTARAHLQGRRRRFKCRSRLYVESAVCAFEVKVKGRRGETVKHRLPYEPSDHGSLTGEARAFLAEHAGEEPALEPVLHTVYARSTLVGPGERVTIDRELSYGTARLRPGWAIVETKSATGTGIADRVLRELGCRPVALSKYLVGIGLTRMAAVPNDARRVSRRYFAHA